MVRSVVVCVRFFVGAFACGERAECCVSLSASLSLRCCNATGVLLVPLRAARVVLFWSLPVAQKISATARAPTERDVDQLLWQERVGCTLAHVSESQKVGGKKKLSLGSLCPRPDSWRFAARIQSGDGAARPIPKASRTR